VSRVGQTKIKRHFLTKKSLRHLAGCVEELVDICLAAVKENWIDVRIEFVSNELLDMFLYLRSKLLVVTDQQLQQLTNEPVYDTIEQFNMD